MITSKFAAWKLLLKKVNEKVRNSRKKQTINSQETWKEYKKMWNEVKRKVKAEKRNEKWSGEVVEDYR